MSLLIGILSQAPPAASGNASCRPPARVGFEVLRAIPRGNEAFTEGLAFFNGHLYESSGLYGRSTVNRIDPGSGSVTRLAGVDASLFAEGLDEWNGVFAMLTWHEHRILRWRSGLSRSPEVISSYPYEGWGLTHDSQAWIASDGTDALHFLGAEDFREIRTIHVKNETTSVPGLNELEFAGGSLFANIYPTATVAQIDPTSGCVLGVLDLSSLREYLAPGDARRISLDVNSVLNGIAYDPDQDVFYLAGKRWPLIFKVRIPVDPSPTDGRLQARSGQRGGGHHRG